MSSSCGGIGRGHATIKRVLVATDFSPAGDRAVQTAAAIARRASAALQILHVAPPRRWLAGFWKANDPLIERTYAQARLALRRVADALSSEEPLEISTGLLMDAASHAIAQTAEEFRAGLVVIGARGEHETPTHRPGLGGTAAALLATTRVPLLLVRKEPGALPPKVLAAVDLAGLSESIVAWACALARGSPFFVFHAYEVAFAARLATYGIRRESIDAYAADEHARRERELASLLSAKEAHAECIVERGDAGSLLFACIARLEADLVVLGKHASHPRRRDTAYGNVCRFISAFAPASVLVVPPSGPKDDHAGVR